MQIRHMTFRFSEKMLARMGESKEAAMAILEAVEAMEVIVRYAGAPLGRPLRSRDVAAQGGIAGHTFKRPHLDVQLPDGEIALSLLTVEVCAPVALEGSMDVVFEVAAPRREGGTWTGAVTGEQTYPVVCVVPGAAA